MPITIMRVKEGKDNIAFEGVDKYMIPELYMKYALYKICYIYRISYHEAISLWYSTSKSKILKIADNKLTPDQLEGRHFKLSSNSA